MTIKAATGVSSTTLKKNGTTVCTATTTAGTICKLEYGTSYTLTANLSTGYTFNSWSKSGSGTIGSTSSYNTTFTPGAGLTTLTPSATKTNYTLTVIYGTGISNVKVNGSTVANNGTVSIPYGTTYTIVATTASDYFFDYG